MHNAAVFLGPSLPVAEARRLLDAQFLPPIQRGDIERLPENIRYIGIIDGGFFQTLAVSPKEVLKALNRGIQVFGSSSMGALRAAETHTFGMIGVGRIFEQFRDGVLDADDEVALAYEPGTYRSLSDPMVNLREALQVAKDEGAIPEEKRQELIALMKAAYFPRRSWRALVRLCPELRLFAQGRQLPDLKRDDAIALLSAMSEARERDSADAQARLLAPCNASCR